jgi:hypothetical protein
MKPWWCFIIVIGHAPTQEWMVLFGALIIIDHASSTI